LAVEYYYHRKRLYIFCISKTVFEGFSVAINEKELFNTIKHLREKTDQKDFLSSTSNDAYLNLLHQLYALLIQPIDSILKSYNDLLIIPHGILQYVSYESLCPKTEVKDYRQLDYLLKTKNIAYSWSIPLWLNRPGIKKRVSYKFAGFAPEFNLKEAKDEFQNYRTELSNLNYIYDEIESANQFHKGELFIKEEATAHKFLEAAPKSKIIHLATHGVIDDLNPMESGFMFSKSKDKEDYDFISATTIYGMDLHADLAVISACNTGYGKLQEGEGVMSLGRAFLHSGCKSILMSLWLANDKSTSEIITNLYKYASENVEKDKALRSAKLEYLESADPITAHPYFWANMIAVGDMTPLDKKASWMWWLGLALMIVLGFLVFRRWSIR
ncbi:MAG: CHAT domain-containing protein, partial [Bacteroidota bacterium]